MIYTALDTFYLTNEQIQNSPSRKEGVDEETEASLRLYGCDMIQEAGIFLRLPQAVMATGQVLFHRFYCKKSFARFNVKRVGASCLWLAAKLEESPRKIRDVLNVFHRMERRRENLPLDLLDHFSKKYEEMKTDLITTERHLLKEMGFICHVEHPHKFIINYLSQLEAGELMQEAWNMANDSLRTTLCVRFKSEVVACGVVYAAARRNLVALPENPPWWEAFDAQKPDIDEVCRVLANLYQQPRPRYIEVGKDSRPFVLTSRAWDPPPSDVQESLLKTAAVAAGNGAVSVPVPPTTSGVDGPPIIEAAVTKVLIERKNVATKDARKPADEAQIPTTNGDARDHATTGKAKQLNDRDDGGVEKSRDKERDRGAERDRDRDRDWDRDRERDRDRARERERERDRDKERERLKERDYRIKDRSRDSGHSDKSRHHSSSRERDFQNAHPVTRDKERHRHRHHPYA
ncbi:cyclin L [Marchantia polymorpha subsp. ruderalis]